MCDLHGSDALDFLRQVKTSTALHRSELSTRFELFVSGDGLTQWVFTQPSEEAYPAMTCRRLSKDWQGHWIAKRKLRCEAGRLTCDRLAAEFERLDELLRRSLTDGKIGHSFEFPHLRA